ncbi:SurA N-terminal domain-containing protein [Kordiimonas marina]|uniref:SurA N-terminal domain-containing protein n=1 Tax=Kordiimonas marina TaxID=2872312 RepID=UPI001FF1C6F4|nr:SurA N-terminal domain-containing protein [Kordiimonas marina]MCJ9428771.1 SurA N-terminal domain-containing protein [Kordiimonas marina]
MLLKLRGGLDHILVTILLGVLIAAFAVWGIGPNLLRGNTKSVAKVGETEIDAQQFDSAVQRRAQQLQQQFGGQISADKLIPMLNLDRQVLMQMISDASVVEHSRELGLRATDDQIIEQLHKIPAFQGPGGSFNQRQMEMVLQRNHLTEKELLSDLRHGITREQLMRSMVAGAAPTKELAKVLYTWKAERRRADMINIPASSITDIAAPTDKQLKTFHDDHKSTYMTPERRSYSYIILTPDQFMDQVKLDDGELEQAYDSRKDEFAKPELRGLNQVTFKDKAAAEAFVKGVKDGKDFVKSAAKATDFSADEINIGDQNRSDLVTDYNKDISDAVFGAKKGDIVGPLESTTGWNVFQVTSITPGTSKSLDDVRDQLTKSLKRDHAVTKMFDFLPDVEDAIAAQGNIKAVAKALKLTLATVSDIDARGRKTDGTPVITQKNEYTVMQTAFHLGQGVEPEVKNLDDKDTTAGVYLVEVNKITEPQQQTLEEVKNQVQAAWMTEAKQKRAGELAEKAKTLLKSGESAEKVALDLGGTSFDAKNVTRTGSGKSGLSANIRGLIFDLPLGGIDAERAADNNGYVVVKVNEIMPGDPAADTKAVDDLYKALETQYSNEMIDQYLAYLSDRYKPEINQGMISRMFPRDAAQ